ncbi:MAG: hypothetical protein ABI634_13345, partial [Acidobacteriota bacterium]
MKLDSSTPQAVLRDRLASGANAAGGWGYYPGKSSRLEPTCWTLLALGEAPGDAAAPHAAFLTSASQSTGWLVEDASWPINVAFNALAAFTWSVRSRFVAPADLQRLLAVLVTTKGVQAPQTSTSAQNNSLQGWPWVEATFSWVEPTAWALLALKHARRAGTAPPGADARIAEAERLLIDRVCRDGGWNYGNAALMHQDLRAYVPTTAMALLALQDRRDDPTVARGLAYIETRWREEVSATAMGLALICLDVHGRSVASLEARLIAFLP